MKDRWRDEVCRIKQYIDEHVCDICYIYELTPIISTRLKSPPGSGKPLVSYRRKCLLTYWRMRRMLVPDVIQYQWGVYDNEKNI